jgi:hypothetical protein
LKGGWVETEEMEKKEREKERERDSYAYKLSDVILTLSQ